LANHDNSSSAPLACCSEVGRLPNQLRRCEWGHQYHLAGSRWVVTPEAFQIVAGGPQTTGSFVIESARWRRARRLAPLRGANDHWRDPVVSASLRPPATIWNASGVKTHRYRVKTNRYREVVLTSSSSVGLS